MYFCVSFQILIILSPISQKHQCKKKSELIQCSKNLDPKCELDKFHLTKSLTRTSNFQVWFHTMTNIKTSLQTPELNTTLHCYINMYNWWALNIILIQTYKVTVQELNLHLYQLFSVIIFEEINQDLTAIWRSANYEVSARKSLWLGLHAQHWSNAYDSTMWCSLFRRHPLKVRSNSGDWPQSPTYVPSIKVMNPQNISSMVPNTLISMQLCLLQFCFIHQ